MRVQVSPQGGQIFRHPGGGTFDLFDIFVVHDLPLQQLKNLI
jgi:hypothetical protein